MKKLALAQKVASLLLLMCFVLPLSKCTGKAGADTHVEIADTFHYGYDVAAAALHGIWTQTDPWESAFWLMETAVVFILPAASLTVRPLVQDGVNFFASFAAGFFLWVWVGLLGTPQPGGVLAVACWALIFISSCTSWWYRLRGLSSPRRQIAAASTPGRR